jgi:hypothetical protein
LESFTPWGFQAIANIAPELPPATGYGDVSRDDEYKRLGAVSLLAGLNLLTGEIVSLIRDTHKSSDFVGMSKRHQSCI